MPRTADHAEQRRRIALATWAVIARDGVLHASVRAIAREAGCTTGMLSHYFRNQRELISFAFSLVIEDLHAALLTGAESLAPGIARIEFLINEFVPIPNEADPQAAVTLACWTLAAGDSELAHQYQDAYELIRLDAKQFVTEAIELGQIPAPARSASELADVVISFADGLMVGALLEPDRFTARRRKAVINQFVTRLCTSS